MASTRSLFAYTHLTNSKALANVQETQIRAASEADLRKRLRLRVAAKMMMYLGFAGVMYVLLSAIFSGDGEVRTVPSLRVDLTTIEPGAAEFLTWEGRPVVVYRRTDADIVALRTEDARIRDPQSANSEQPEFATNTFRSRNAEVFVAIALGTGQGCTVEHLPASTEPFQGQAWAGGFMDSCGKDRFDLAGRVYDKQYANKNLKVPQYDIDGATLVLGR